MYKNQYIISNMAYANHDQLKITTFNNLHVYSHQSLNISHAKNLSSEILLLGYIINPFKPYDNNDDIVKELAESCNSKEALFKKIQQLSGRFSLLFKNGIEFIVVNDACALRQLYYAFIDNNIFLTSSPRMFLDFYGGELQSSDDKLNFTKLEEYEMNDHEWYGDKCIDNRLMKVLPNHHLDITNRTIKRTSIYFDQVVNEKDIIEYSAALLKGNMAAITKRYKVIQPLTAGWDSRTLLAASKEYLHDIQFYVIDFSGADKLLPDVWVSKNLSEKLGLNYQVVKLKGPSDKFSTIFKREHILPRLTYLAEIEYLYDNYANNNTVRVNGIAGATLKAVYGYTNYHIDTRHFHHFTHYLGKSQFIKDELRDWVNDAQGYAQEYGIPLLDLLHWEQKVGNWGAMTVSEQDIAIENFSPHANRNLFASILRINAAKRAKPQCLLISKIINTLWPEVLSEPVNPVGYIKSIRRMLHSNALVANYKLRLQAVLKHSGK